MAIRSPLPALGAVPLGPAFALLLTGLLGGCGRSAEAVGQPATEAPTSLHEENQKSESGPETLEQAEADLEQARLALVQLAGPASPAPAAAAPAAAPPAAPAPVETMSARKEKKSSRAMDEGAGASAGQAAPKRAAPANQAAEAEDAAAKTDDNPCLTTCKAYASLLRAKNAVCRLDAPNGERCARAEGIVRDATPRVQSCQCSPP